jgi:hypothetical protein
MTTFSELKIGDSVKDSDGNEGKIISMETIHNVDVELMSGGKGIYCLDPDCEDLYDPLEKIQK